MCDQCDEQTEGMRPVVDKFLNAERAYHKLHARMTQGQHVIRFANVVLDCHGDDGHLSHADVSAIVTEYSIVVQRLLALEEMTGLTG